MGEGNILKNSEKMFLDVLQEKHAQYKGSLNALLDAFSNNDQAAKIDANLQLNKISKDLSSILAQADRPPWLVRAIELTGKFAKVNPNAETARSGSSWNLVKELILNYEEAIGYQWTLTEQDESNACNFDVVFIEARKETNLTNLFDAMINDLEKLLATGQIDSIKAIDSLKKLLDTLSENKNGSYFSTIASWQFAKTFTKNVVWQSLEDIKTIKTIKTAFEKTLSDMDIEWDTLHKRISTELKEQFEIESNSSLSHDKKNPLYIESSDQ